MVLVMNRKTVGDAEGVQGLAGWLLAAAARANMQWVRSLAQRRPARRHMRVVETMQLGGRRQLTLVSCDGERFLVGSGPDSVQTMLRVRPESAGAPADGMGAVSDKDRRC